MFQHIHLPDVRSLGFSGLVSVVERDGREISAEDYLATHEGPVFEYPNWGDGASEQPPTTNESVLAPNAGPAYAIATLLHLHRD